MIIDIAVLVFMLLMLIRGIATGAFRYIYRLLGLLGAVFTAHYTAPQAAEFIHNNVGVSLKTAYSVCTIAIIIVAAIILTLIISWVLNPIITAFIPKTNRVLGAIGGLASGLVLSYLFLWIILAAQANFPKWALLKKIEPDTSITFNFVKSHNYLSDIDFAIMPKLEALENLAKNPQELLPKDLTDNALLQDLFKSRELTEKLKNGNFRDLLENNKMQEILKDPNIMKKLEEISVEMPPDALNGRSHR